MRADQEIQREIIEEVITETLLLDPGPIAVTVIAGVVWLSGAASRESDARLTERLASQVDGVVAVRSELTYRYDDSGAPVFPPRELDTWPLRYRAARLGRTVHKCEAVDPSSVLEIDVIQKGVIAAPEAAARELAHGGGRMK